MRYRLTVEYLGTRYHGWQGQQNARSVQGELARAAADLLGHPAEVQGSGRTDAGVHALGQVAHLDARVPLPAERLVRGLNDRLPQDINVLDARAVGERFHARHDAVSRSYLYQVSRRRTAFGKALVWWVRDPLDAGAMREGAACLPGLRDFAGFADKRVEKDTSTRVLVEQALVAEAGELILVRLRASHFLWKMVRRVVGCLVGLGRGEISVAEFAGFLRAPSPYPARVTAPPSGLFLEEVVYAGESFRRPLAPVLAVEGAATAPGARAPSAGSCASGGRRSRERTPRRGASPGSGGA